MECLSEGSDSSGHVVFERGQLYKWMEESGFRNFTDRINFVKSKLAEGYNVEEFMSFAHQLKERWDRTKSMKKRFEKWNKEWLKGTVKLRSICTGRSHQKDCALTEFDASGMTEAAKTSKPSIFTKEELVPEDAVFDNDFESVCSETEEVCGEVVAEAGDTREPEPFVEFECETPSMTSSKPVDPGGLLPARAIYTCNLCDYTCSLEMDLKKHLKTHVGEDLFTCDQCEYLCRLEYELEVHKATQHIMSELYHCSKCSYFCRNRKNMARHQEIHLSLSTSHCDTCDRNSEEFAMEMSLSSDHSRTEQYLCAQCGNCCVSEDTFKRHQSSHSGDALLYCDICDYNCQQDLDLKKHKKTHHSREMLYACDRCSYSCRDDSDFGRHLLSHSREKSTCRRMIYACNMCDFRCQYSDSLKGHIMTHLSEDASFSGEDTASSVDSE